MPLNNTEPCFKPTIKPYHEFGPHFLIFSMIMVVSSCASLPGSGGDYSVGYQEKALASWYGEPFHGRRTANGEIYDMYGLTAAHRLMPLGTVVEVVHRKNGKSVRVRINDRGPFIRGRNLDLSYGAAKKLNMVADGTGPVTLRIVNLPQVSSSSIRGLYTVQVGAFKNKENALRLVASLKKRYSSVHLVLARNEQNPVYRIQVGALKEKALALRLVKRLLSENKLDGFVTRQFP